MNQRYRDVLDYEVGARIVVEFETRRREVRDYSDRRQPISLNPRGCSGPAESRGRRVGAADGVELMLPAISADRGSNMALLGFVRLCG